MQAKHEYFFVMTDRIADHHSWIYVHQQRSSLCIHRLDRSGTGDELNVCAQDLGSMEELSDNSELYVCSNYLKDEKRVRIQVGRPNYNSADRDTATIILSVSILVRDGAPYYEGPPQYYSVASGSLNNVIVRNMYMTNLDYVTCARPYTKQAPSVGKLSETLYQSCDLTCHEECSGGCNRPNDAKACVECMHDTLWNGTQFECIPSCVALTTQNPDVDTEMTEIVVRLADGENDAVSVPIGTFRNADNVTFTNIFIDGPLAPASGYSTCKVCHPECDFGCTGTANTDCISPNYANAPYNKRCANVQDGLEFGRCLAQCPDGFYPKENSLLRINDTDNGALCERCHESCQTCLSFEDIYNAPSSEDGYTRQGSKTRFRII